MNPTHRDCRIQIRDFRHQKFYDPKKILVNLRALELLLDGRVADQKVRELRTRKLRSFKEGRQAAIFCYGISTQVLGLPTEFARFERSDYDCVFRWVEGENLHYSIIQLKELVPDTVDPKATLEKEFTKLTKKYVSSNDLTVAIHVNKAGTIKLKEIRVPNLNLGQLWIYGVKTPDQNNWWLFGDLLNNPTLYTFSYPQPSCRDILCVKGYVDNQARKK